MMSAYKISIEICNFSDIEDEIVYKDRGILPRILDYLLDGDSTILEKKPLETLAHEQNLTAFKHNGFWHPMDTLRDKNYLENLWFDNKANWKIW